MGDIAFDFTGRTVLVTGAARGIGLELSRFFAASGADVAMVDSDLEELTAVASSAKGFALQADVSSTADVTRAVEAVLSEFGRIDVLVNNAGILRDSVVWKMSDDDWDTVLNVHAGGTFRFTRACVPHFRAQGAGRIVNVTFYSGLRGNTGQANYSTAKAGTSASPRPSRRNWRASTSPSTPSRRTRPLGWSRPFPRRSSPNCPAPFHSADSPSRPRCARLSASWPRTQQPMSRASSSRSTAESRSDINHGRSARWISHPTRRSRSCRHALSHS